MYLPYSHRPLSVFVFSSSMHFLPVTAACLILVSLAVTVRGYGNGAPPVKCGASGDMTPIHSNIPAQTSAFPYTLTTSQTTYRQGTNLTRKNAFIFVLLYYVFVYFIKVIH